MSDGTGKINLQSLSLQDYYLYDSAFTEYGADGYYYKYNPCQGFYFDGYYDTAVRELRWLILHPMNHSGKCQIKRLSHILIG